MLIPEAKKKDFLETQCACGVVLGTKTYVYCRFFLLIPPRDIATPLNNWRSFRRHPRNTRCAKTQWPNLFGPKRLDDKANLSQLRQHQQPHLAVAFIRCTSTEPLSRRVYPIFGADAALADVYCPSNFVSALQKTGAAVQEWSCGK